MRYPAGILLFAGASLLLAQEPDSLPQPEKVEASRCHAFVDFRNIWTVEMVEADRGRIVPILNVITFDQPEAPLRPDQIHIRTRDGSEARVEKFSIDTGVPGDPYRTSYLKVLKSSFLGLDLMGDFDSFPEPSQVQIELGDWLFHLQAVDCLDFESLAEQINQINFNSPDVREDFEILEIEPIGSRQRRHRGRF